MKKILLIAFALVIAGCAGKRNPEFENYSAYSILAADGYLFIEARGLHSLDLGGGYPMDMPHEMIKHLEAAIGERNIQATMPEALDRQFFDRPRTGNEKYRVMVYLMRGTYKDRPATGKLIYGISISDPTLARYDALQKYRYSAVFEDETMCRDLGPLECKKAVSSRVMAEILSHLDSFLKDFDYK